MSWHTVRLGDVVTLKRGHDLPESKRQDGTVPVVSSSGITGYHNQAKAEAPGVVTGRYGTIGEVFNVEEDYWPLNTALYVVDFKGNDARFIAYFLRNILGNYQSDKAAVPGVNRNVLHELKVRFTDTKSQERIAGVLSTYDDLIENNLRRMALLEESARLLYREWFVRLVSLSVTWEHPRPPSPGRERPIEPWSTETGAEPGSSRPLLCEPETGARRHAARIWQGRASAEW